MNPLGLKPQDKIRLRFRHPPKTLGLDIAIPPERIARWVEMIVGEILDLREAARRKPEYAGAYQLAAAVFGGYTQLAIFADAKAPIRIIAADAGGGRPQTQWNGFPVYLTERGEPYVDIEGAPLVVELLARL